VFWSISMLFNLHLRSIWHDDQQMMCLSQQWCPCRQHHHANCIFAWQCCHKFIMILQTFMDTCMSDGHWTDQSWHFLHVFNGMLQKTCELIFQECPPLVSGGELHLLCLGACPSWLLERSNTILLFIFLKSWHTFLFLWCERHALLSEECCKGWSFGCFCTQTPLNIAEELLIWAKTFQGNVVS